MFKILSVFILFLAIMSSSFAQQTEKTDSFLGEWQEAGGKYFAQIYLSTDGAYKANLTTNLTSRGTPLAVLSSEKGGENVLNLSGDGWAGKISKGKLTVSKGNEQLVMQRIFRTSPTMNAAPPKNAIILFDGKNLDAWTKVLEKDWLVGGTPVDNWKIVPGGFLEAGPHEAGAYESIISRQKFGDIKLHVEFRLLGPVTNGGVYLMSRYELNIKDAFGQAGGSPIGFGNIADPKELYPDVNVAFPPMQWQTFDIDFKAPRFDASGTKKTEDARITVDHNGVTIYKDVALKAVRGSTAKLGEAGVGPIYLQEHGVAYQFKNIWVIDKTIKGTEAYHTVVSAADTVTKTGGSGKSGGNKAGGKKGGGKKAATGATNEIPKYTGGKDIDASYDAESNPVYATPSIVTTADASGKPAKPAGFNHPGVLLTRTQLAEIKKRVSTNVEPQKSAFEKMKSDPYAALNYKANPVEIVSCGPRSNPDIGCKVEQADCAAAYAQALMWTITGNKVYAENAIQIMNAWAETLKGGHNYANGPVQAAWSGSVWPRAAEIIRYTYSGWSDKDIAKFQNMLRTQYLPSIMHGDCENGNKELAMCEALINIGVFCEDRSVFDLGVKMWRGRTPAYIYLKSDGPAPIEPPGCGPAIWGNKGLTPEFVDGLLQETARDSHHPTMAFASMSNAAETAFIQDVDLYKEQGKRMMAAIEFEAQYIKPNNVPAPANLTFALNSTWEIAYNHFHNRLKNNLPKMAAALPLDRPSTGNHHVLWETLTHGEIGAVGLSPVTKK